MLTQRKQVVISMDKIEYDGFIELSKRLTNGNNSELVKNLVRMYKLSEEISPYVDSIIENISPDSVQVKLRKIIQEPEKLDDVEKNLPHTYEEINRLAKEEDRENQPRKAKQDRSQRKKGK